MQKPLFDHFSIDPVQFWAESDGLARFYEGRAVQGLIAGNMTKTNKIGYIASFPIPEVIMGINAYFHHAKLANPDVELVVTWAYTWFDPAKEADAARSDLRRRAEELARLLAGRLLGRELAS